MIQTRFGYLLSSLTVCISIPVTLGFVPFHFVSYAEHLRVILKILSVVETYSWIFHVGTNKVFSLNINLFEKYVHAFYEYHKVLIKFIRSVKKNVA